MRDIETHLHHYRRHRSTLHILEPNTSHGSKIHTYNKLNIKNSGSVLGEAEKKKGVRCNVDAIDDKWDDFCSQCIYNDYHSP